MKFEHRFQVGVEWADRNKQITNKGLIEMFSNLATMHGISVGHTTNTGDSVISWVVLNWKVEVFRRPHILDTVLVRTWGTEYTRLRATRDFDVYTEAGELVAKATSVWVGLDGKTGEFVKLSPENMDVYAPEPENQNFPGYKFPNIQRMELSVIDEKEISICRCMIDYNEHVHNSAYLDLADEVLPEEVYRNSWNHAEVTYKQELHLQDRVLLQYAKEGEKHVVFLRRAEGSELCAAVVLY